MPKQNGVVNIGLNIDYQKALQEMVSNFKSELTAISNAATKANIDKDIVAQIDNINKKINGISGEFKQMFDEISNQTINANSFEKYQADVTKKFAKIKESIYNTTAKIEGLKERIGALENSEFATKMKAQFDEISQSVLGTYNELRNVVEITKEIGSAPSAKLSESMAKDYKETLDVIKRVKKETEDLNFDDIDDSSLNDGLSKHYKYLQDNIESYRQLKKEIAGMSKEDTGYDKKANEFRRLAATIYEAYASLQMLSSLEEDRTGNVGAEYNKFLNDLNKKDKVGKIPEQLEKWDVGIERILNRSKEAVDQIQGTFNTFQVKDGAIHIPIDIATSNDDLKNKINEIIQELRTYVNGQPIIAKVKLTLDKSSSKGYKKNDEVDKQQVEGQGEPALDLTKSIQKTYRDAAREAEVIVKQQIKEIQENLKEVKIKIKPDDESFASDLSNMVNKALKGIANETSGLNVNKQLEKLVENLKEISSSLSGNENFKLGLDEGSIDRITKAIENMANMIQRAFKVASDSDIESQWTAIEAKFKSVATESGTIDGRLKANKVAMSELAIEYQKYLDMGGTKNLSELTSHKGTVDNLNKAYKDLGKAVEETANKQKKQSSTSKTSKADSDNIKAITRENKKLESQAENTSGAIEKEGNVAQEASTKFRKLAKEKGAAVVANRELAKAAKETADALERESKARKSGSGKTNKNAVDDVTYADNYLKWQDEIKQSLLDSGNYAEVYEAKITQAANGTVKFTAIVRDLDGELKKFSANVNNSGNMFSPSISDMPEKQAENFKKDLALAEKVKEALSAIDDEGETTSLLNNRKGLEDTVGAIIKATQELETFDTKYNVVLNKDGSLNIVKSVKEASGQVKTFTAKFESVKSVITEVEDSVGNVIPVVKDLNAALESGFDKGSFSTTTKDFTSKAQEAFDKFNLKHRGDSGLGEISSELAELDLRIKSIGDQQGLDEFKQDLSDLGAKLKNIKSDAKLGEILDPNRTFGNINDVRSNIDSLFASMGKVNEKSIKIEGTDKLTAEVKAANGEIRKMTVSLDSNNFARFVDNGIVQFGRLRAVAEGVFKGIQSMVRIYLSPQDFIRYFRQGFDTVREIDTAMTELKKVSDAPMGDIVDYFDDAVVSAKELGSSVKDMISATADWARLGYNLPDSRELGEVAVLYKNVGDGIDIDTANESLVSTIQGFQLQAKDAMAVIDSFNEVSNNYAISSAGIGEALKRSAAAFNAANTDLNQSIALITAGNEIVQSPEKVGTMWQTVSARIRGTKSDLEELGESTEDVLSTSKLRSLVMGYTDVDIMKDKDTYKDIYTIISEIGEKWKDLKDVDKAALLEGLAGCPVIYRDSPYVQKCA